MGFLTQVLLPLLISGTMLAGIYMLVSVGLSLVFGVMEVVNFAHGAFVMIGGYIAYFGFTRFGVSPFLALLVVVPVMFVMGYVLQKTLVEYVLADNEIYSLLLTFGIALAAEGLMKVAFQTVSRSIHYLSTSVDLIVVSTSANRLAAGLSGYIFAGALFLFLAKSTFGQAIRATSQAPDLAEACGIDAPKVRAATFGIGAVLAGIGGVMYLLVYQVSPIGGRSILLVMFIIIVLGGMGSLKGTAIAGLIIGLFQTIATYFAGGHATFFVLYSGIALILLVRPYGLFGEPQTRHG